MSPNNKKKLIVLRKKLDLLDNQLIKILKKNLLKEMKELVLLKRKLKVGKICF